MSFSSKGKGKRARRGSVDLEELEVILDAPYA